MYISIKLLFNCSSMRFLISVALSTMVSLMIAGVATTIIAMATTLAATFLHLSITE
jgi:hypothetical protein